MKDVIIITLWYAAIALSASAVFWTVKYAKATNSIDAIKIENVVKWLVVIVSAIWANIIRNT